MKVKLLEHYQDARVTLGQGEEREVSDNLGAWLIENHKAVEVAEPAKEPVKEVEPQGEMTIELPKRRGSK